MRGSARYQSRPSRGPRGRGEVSGRSPTHSTRSRATASPLTETGPRARVIDLVTTWQNGMGRSRRRHAANSTFAKRFTVTRSVAECSTGSLTRIDPEGSRRPPPRAAIARKEFVEGRRFALPVGRAAHRAQGLRRAAVPRAAHLRPPARRTRVPRLPAGGRRTGARALLGASRPVHARHRLDRRGSAGRPPARRGSPRDLRPPRRGDRRAALSGRRDRRSPSPRRARRERRRVHVVDLAAAYTLGTRPGSFRRRVFERLSSQDRLAAARMRARFTGASENEALAKFDPAAVRLWGTGRRIKGFWDRLRGKRS